MQRPGSTQRDGKTSLRSIAPGDVDRRGLPRRATGGARIRFCRGGITVLFEDQPLALVVLVIAVVESWLRVRKPLFRTAGRLREVLRASRRSWSQDDGTAS